MNLDDFIKNNFLYLEECYNEFIIKIPFEYRSLIEISFFNFAKHMYNCYKVS